MDRLTAQLRSLAADDAARTDPSDANVEHGWTRLSASLAAPIAATPVGLAGVNVGAKKIAGAIALAVLGLSAAAAPLAIDRNVASVEPVVADDPVALEPTRVRGGFASVPPPARPKAPAPQVEPDLEPPPREPPQRARVAVDPLVAELRALATARAHLDSGRFREALAAARKLLRARRSQLAPEARAIEAVAACKLGLPRAPELAARYLQQHATSPHRKRVAAACEH